MARINFVELPVGDTGAAKGFYETTFGWSLTAFGPTYASTMTGDVDVGLQGDTAEATTAPLPVIDVTGSAGGLDAWPAKIEAAGGTILRPIFAFPGGRRFQFTDPAGNELAVMEADPE